MRSQIPVLLCCLFICCNYSNSSINISTKDGNISFHSPAFLEIHGNTSTINKIVELYERMIKEKDDLIDKLMQKNKPA